MKDVLYKHCNLILPLDETGFLTLSPWRVPACLTGRTGILLAARNLFHLQIWTFIVIVMRMKLFIQVATHTCNTLPQFLECKSGSR